MISPNEIAVPVHPEETFRLFVENVRDHAIFLLDPSGRVATWNIGAERLKGYSAREIVGKHVSEFYGADEVQAGEPERHLRWAAEEGRVEEEGWRVRKDGSRFWANVVTTAVRDGSGRLLGFARITRDRSERRADEQLIQKLKRELRQRVAQSNELNRQLDSFSYSVSHDLRAPLSSISGFSKALLEDCGERLGDQGREHVERMCAATHKMVELLGHLLELSRLTRVQVRAETVDLADLARKAMAELRASERGRVVEFRCPHRLAVRGDAALLRQMVQNLVGNAWKFTSRKTSARIELGCVPRNGQPVYFVRDDGAGFSMAYSDRLFRPFQRLHTNEDFEGHGIGLATVKRIVERHGGWIWAEAAPGQGATFFFSLRTGADQP